jgi:hypothetical protein
MSGIQHNYVQISTSSTGIPPKIIKLEQTSDVGYSSRNLKLHIFHEFLAEILTSLVSLLATLHVSLGHRSTPVKLARTLTSIRN